MLFLVFLVVPFLELFVILQKHAPKRVILNLAEVPYMDSSAIAVLGGTTSLLLLAVFAGGAMVFAVTIGFVETVARREVLADILSLSTVMIAIVMIIANGTSRSGLRASSLSVAASGSGVEFVNTRNDTHRQGDSILQLIDKQVAGVAIVPGAYGRNVERLNTALQAMDAELGIAGKPAAGPAGAGLAARTAIPTKLTHEGRRTSVRETHPDPGSRAAGGSRCPRCPRACRRCRHR